MIRKEESIEGALQTRKNNKKKKNKIDNNNKNKDGTYPPCPHRKKTNHPQRKCWWRLDSQQHEEAKSSTKQHQEEQLLLQHASQQGKGIVAIESLTGFKVIFQDKWCMIKDAKGRDVFKVKMRAKSFALNLMEDEQIAFSSTVSNAELWHRRLAFPPCVPLLEDKLADCVACQYGKQTRRPFPQTAWRAMHKLQLVDNGKEYTNEILISFVKRDKLDKKAKPGVFIGYSNSSKAYRIFQPQNGKILVSRDVKFMEDRQWNWEESIKMQLPEVPQYFDEDIDDVPVRVARLDTIRMLLALTTQKDGKLTNWMIPSQGTEEKVYLLKKALYGLKQAPVACRGIDEHLQSLGFVKSPSEATLYVKGTDANLIVVSVYVDDLLVTGSNEKLVKEFKVEMLKVFEMTDLGLMSYFMGMEVKQDHDGVFISQKKYAKEILNKFHMEDCKGSDTNESKEKFSKDDGEEKWMKANIEVDWLLDVFYTTALHIMFSIACFQDSCICAVEVHIQAPKGLFCFTLDPNFSWSSKKQDVIAQSTAEKILADLHMKQNEPTQIHTKHFKIKLYHLREEQKDGEVKLLYCKTENQIVDVLTKALPKARFETLRSKIGLCNY
ncbi:hypothetical protein AAG906_035533 [Vitis piasezkii]